MTKFIINKKLNYLFSSLFLYLYKIKLNQSNNSILFTLLLHLENLIFLKETKSRRYWRFGKRKKIFRIINHAK